MDTPGAGSQPRAPTPPPNGWVVIEIPNELRLGPLGIAANCSWDLNGRPDGLWEVRPKERAWTMPRQLFQPQLLLRAADAGRQGAYGGLTRLPPQDEYISEATRRLALAEAERLLGAQTREAAWEALGLLAVGAADAELPSRLQSLYSVMAPQLPRSSVWTVTVDPVFESRRSLVRVLVAAADAPEMLHADRPFEGLKMGRGLTAPLTFLPLMKMPLLALAPGLLGLAAARATGLVVVLFGKLEAGRAQVGQSSLIDLYRPNLLATPVADTASFLKPIPAHVEELLLWWCERLNAIHDVLLDPVRYNRGDSTYDPVSHYGDLISFDRLVAAVNTILVGSRREEFSRRLMLFQALDILEGFRQGTYSTLLDRDVLASHLQKLRARIPKNLQPFLLPRCERALEALKAVDSGWLKERIGPQGLTVMKGPGQTEFRPLKRASADYVRLVRNAGHALRKSLEAPESRSLLVSHSGDLPPELSDLAFLHFLRLLVTPDLIKQAPVKAIEVKRDSPPSFVG